MADETQKSDSLKKIPASEILSKIEKGEPVEYDNVTIKGDIDLMADLDQHQLNMLKEQEGLEEIIQSKIVKLFIKITNSSIEGNLNFSNVIFEQNIYLSDVQLIGNAQFAGTQFNATAIFERSEFAGHIDFNGSLFNQHASFSRSQFNANAEFSGSQFNGPAEFFESRFLGNVDFGGSQFKDVVYFSESHFQKDVSFINSKFCYFAEFSESQFNGVSNFSKTEFDKVNFCESIFNGNALFSGANVKNYIDFTRSAFNGDYLTFENTIFDEPWNQEYCCRKAKKLLEEKGDREAAGYYFYQEMDAKRKQKPWYYRYPEFVFIQLIFGYGVHPFRLMAWWLSIILVFGIFYLIGNGIDGAIQPFDYLKVSFATALAPGYIATIINPGNTGYRVTPEYQVVAMIETIFGTFLWAAFIATFAKKYMR